MISALLLSVLISVESAGHAHAIGDHGKAHGCLQIHRAVVVDVNRFAGTHYRLNDAYSPEDAKDICRLYLTHYATPARLGHAPTDEDRVRIWNGGGTGWRKSSTLPYWYKVRSRLNQHVQRFQIAQK